MREGPRIEPEALAPRDEVAREIEHHLTEMAERLVDAGWDPDAARAEAERRFGEGYRPRLERIVKRRKTMMGLENTFDTVRRGVGGVARTLRRTPGFAAAVALTLALGIGANAAMFGMVDRLLLRPPAHLTDADELRLVQLQRETGLGTTLTYPDFDDLRAHPGLAGVAGYSHQRELTLGSGQEALDITGRMVSHEFFGLLGVPARLGRTFAPDDDRIDAAGTVVLSEELWQRAYGGDVGVLGRTLRISGHDWTVIGVAPGGFTGATLDRVDVWLPLEAGQYRLIGGNDGWRTSRQWWWMAAVARLAEGVGDEAASAEATRLHQNGRSEGRDERYTTTELRMSPLRAAMGSDEELRVVRWLAGVSLVVLLIACANVANLLLARGVRRRREVAVRLALGVSRRRLVTEHVVESVGLAAIGGALAVALAYWGAPAMQRVLLPEVYFPDAGLNPRVLVFAVVASLLAGMLAGLGPALQSSRADLGGDLSSARRGSSGRRSRLRGGLAVAQASLSVVLLVGAGLFVKSLANVRGLDLGLDIDRLASAALEFEARGLTPTERNAVYERAARHVARLPGVEGVTLTSAPLQWSFATALRIPGIDSIPRLPSGGPYYHAVAPGYHDVVGLRVLRGRGFEATDVEGGPPVAIVSRTMAETTWPNGDPLGACLIVGNDNEICRTVVGVVEDAARGGLQEEPFQAYYLPLGQVEFEAQAIYARAADPGAVAGAMAEALRGFDATIRFARSETLREVLDPQARAWTLGATMFTVFGLLALVVASVGLYSLLAFEVAERTRELGIRSALGARQSRLLGNVLVQGARLAVGGIALGLFVAWLAGPYARDLLFEVSPRDPAVLGGVAAVLLLVAGAASLLPGVRATRVDPNVALRAE